MSTTTTIEARVNGEWRAMPRGSTLHDLLGILGLPAKGIAIAARGDIVPADQWDSHTVEAGDAIEIVTAVQGG
ncbi:sulfur carrier protein ThiS [Hoyosella sp. G463]|uniref:Sulfur carrier protein ThiS n=1 Tax=Lolliginicoccus lacisalsi TaxID=2742202 RepID=A0A927PN89_9ACTN|nr:sulfur carrier protein ThiS [Lolliginicoccus lacisalsi]MBD8507396.1 sulfur carrier protein ThiS [Lolliginicoccus lacisalsi]